MYLDMCVLTEANLREVNLKAEVLSYEQVPKSSWLKLSVSRELEDYQTILGLH